MCLANNFFACSTAVVITQLHQVGPSIPSTNPGTNSTKKRKVRQKNVHHIPTLNNTQQFPTIMISVGPRPHHLLHKTYECNTSSTTIALTATSPAMIHPLVWSDLLFFFLNTAPFPPRQFCCVVSIMIGQGGQGNYCKGVEIPPTPSSR